MPPQPLPPALDDEARQFALLLRSVTDYAIYTLDPRGIIRSWNAGGERIKGYRAGEIIGQNFSRFYTPEDIAAGAPQRSLAIARDTGKFEADGWRVRKDGSRFRASVLIEPIHEDDELIGFAKVTRDITERFNAEQELATAQRALARSQKLEAMGRLTLGLAHDFNNLLTIMVNSMDLIATHPSVDTRTQRLIETALRAADRGALLTRQLLAFGRGQKLAPEQRDVDALLQRSMDIYRRACGSGIALEVRAARDLPPIEVDVSQFEAAILNLITNSSDAMPAGGRIRLGTSVCRTGSSADPVRGGRDYVCVTVEDDGEGIPPEIQERVFEPFFTTKDVGKGSGLGLSQVFGFATQSGGFVELSSTPGVGTVVRLCLPVGGDAS